MKQSLTLLAFFCLFNTVKAQTTDTAFLITHAALSADSLNKAYENKLWDQYANHTYPGMIRFLGGKPGLIDYTERLWMHLNMNYNETIESQLVKQVVYEEDHWQCVIEKVKDCYIGERKAKIWTYMVGKSIDDGNSWKFFEISEGMLNNAREVMHEISDELLIPLRKIVYADEVKPETPAPAVKKKTVKKKVAKK
jgi:hypothetical protein